MSATINSKFMMDSSEGATEERFIEFYQAMDGKKRDYLKKCALLGFLVRESCLGDLIVAISKQPEYINANDAERYKIMVAGLRHMIGGAAVEPVAMPVPAVEPMVEDPTPPASMPTVEPVAAPTPTPTPTVEPVAAPTPTPTPTPTVEPVAAPAVNAEPDVDPRQLNIEESPQPSIVIPTMVSGMGFAPDLD